MNGYNASPDLPPPLYVRALYDYDADDQTSLSFRQGDIIQVLTQVSTSAEARPKDSRRTSRRRLRLPLANIADLANIIGILARIGMVGWGDQ